MTIQEERAQMGILFCPGDPELRALKLKAHNLNTAYNATFEDQREEREEILSRLLGEMGEGCFLQGPIFFHYGCHTRLGKNVFINFNFTAQDDAFITIGDNCNFGPNVSIVTPVHPMLPEERRTMLNENGEPKHLVYARPVVIGKDCWFGANVVVCPGVTIGDGCVIGAGAVVTRDIPPMTFAAGNPARVIRELTEQDSMAYKPQRLGGCRVME